MSTTYTSTRSYLGWKLGGTRAHLGRKLGGTRTEQAAGCRRRLVARVTRCEAAGNGFV